MPLNIYRLPKISFDNCASLPEISGVYVALSHTYNVLYIGAAYNLRSRWRQHQKLHEVRKHRCAYIAWHESSIANMYAIEKAAIVTYSPILNRQRLFAFQVPISINGQRVQEARRVSKMTQGELAKKMGCRLVYVERIERGLPTGLYLPTLHSLCRTLNVSPAYLLRQEA